MYTTKDYGLAAVAGVLTGLFLIPTVLNIGYDNTVLLAALPIVCGIAWIVGLKIGEVMSRWLPIMPQLSRFAEIGVLNTAINFGVLNFWSLMTGETAGLAVGGYNVPATIIAATNSYFWNKLWVFKKIDNKGLFNDVPKFAVVTVLALVVNSVIIVAFTSYWEPIAGINRGAWLNIGKVLATIVGVLVDFLGYKYIVFKTKETIVQA